MTISDRLKEVSKDRPRGWQADLARKCGVSAPSVSGWLSGDSKTIDADNLFRAADFFNVNPRWLCLGIGPKTPGEMSKNVVALEQDNSVRSALAVLSDALHPASKQTRKTAAEMLANFAMDPRGGANIVNALEVLLDPPRPVSEKNRAA